MKNLFLYICFSLLIVNSIQAQIYSPQAGVAGSTAIYKDSLVFVNWVSECKIIRGYQDISNGGLGFANGGDSSLVYGIALSNGVVSLGDGGIAICKFPFPIKDGGGNDFAVFENSFDGLFLELAFVEVSSDGEHFFRFPSHSLIDTNIQVGSFGYTDATKINNLAGKYQAGYGTPFDLNDVPNNALLNKNSITHVKVIDCVGSINNIYATRDSYNNKVNEPWPTPFGSSGFDLDAIGVINQNTIIGVNEFENLDNRIALYPIPINSNETLHIYSAEKIKECTLFNASGNIIENAKSSILHLPTINSGLYILNIETEKGTIHKKIIIQ